jgi:hypothetical protein
MQPPMQPPPPPSGYSPQPAPYGQPYALPDAPGSLVSMILGIVGLVLSFLGCCGVFAVVPAGLGIAALVLGFQARGKIAAAPGQYGGSGKALAGIITGGIAVALAVILLLLSLALGVGLRSLVNSFPSPTVS